MLKKCDNIISKSSKSQCLSLSWVAFNIVTKKKEHLCSGYLKYCDIHSSLYYCLQSDMFRRNHRIKTSKAAKSMLQTGVHLLVGYMIWIRHPWPGVFSQTANSKCGLSANSPFSCSTTKMTNRSIFREMNNEAVKIFCRIFHCHSHLR